MSKRVPELPSEVSRRIGPFDRFAGAAARLTSRAVFFTFCVALILIWALIALTAIDYDTQLLPDSITLPLLWCGLAFNLANAYAVGDSLRDLQAAATSGAKPVLVLSGKGKGTQADGGLPEGTLVFDDLAAVVEHILNS